MSTTVRNTKKSICSLLLLRDINVVGWPNMDRGASAKHLLAIHTPRTQGWKLFATAVLMHIGDRLRVAPEDRKACTAVHMILSTCFRDKCAALPASFTRDDGVKTLRLKHRDVAARRRTYSTVERIFGGV